MQLGKIIRDFSDEARAGEVLIACGDLVLLARIGEVAGRFDETVGEYATGAVQRFANLASSEDWLALMNAIERADDPAFDSLSHMLNWSLKQDEAEPVSRRAPCSCGGDCAGAENE